MSLAFQKEMPIAAIREKLEAVPGVDRAVVEGDCLWLICLPHSSSQLALEAASEILRSSGVDPETVSIEAAVRVEQRDRQRVRFEQIERTEEADMRVRVRVSLEWQGMRVQGDATGEKGSNIELRTAALAAVDAIERISEKPVGVRLAGVKQVRAFDAEITVVSLFQSGPEFQKYLGVVLVNDDPLRAAALAVLHALNRVLGNFLVTR
jgi:hypothetical protein